MPSLVDETPDYLLDQLRNFLRDHPKVNRLLGGQEESNDEDLALALHNALDEFNTMPPPIGQYGFENFPSRSLLIHGAAIWALESAGILESRNRLQYSEGGLNVAVSDSAQDYRAWIQSFTQKYMRRMQKLKKTINLESCYGQTESEYSDINSYT